MTLPHGVRRTFRLLLPASLRDEVDEELRFHLEARERELIESGMDPDAARTEARERFGDVGAIRRGCHEIARRKERTMRRTRLFEELRQDAVFALRQARQDPGPTLLAILTLALGIGATTALFAALHAVVLAPMPFPEAEEVVRLWEVRDAQADGSGGSARRAPRRGDLSAGDFLELRRQAPGFEVVAASRPDSFTLLREQTPERLFGARVTPGYFRVFGIEPIHGRLFAADEAGPDRNAVAVLGHEVFRNHFGADPGTVGRIVRIDGQPHMVIGVLPPAYEAVLKGQGIWTPLVFPEDPVVRWDEHTFECVGRLADGVPLEQAREQLRILGRRIADLHPGGAHGRALTADPYAQDLLGNDARLLWILFGAVALVLVIACADVANLLLARGAQREREMAVRAALGAGRSRLVRQLLTESVVLAFLGAGAGLAVAAGGLRLIATFSPVQMPRLEQAALNGPVLTFALIATVLSSLLFGLFPALRLAAGNAREALAGGFGGRRTTRSGQVLVATEIALSLVLLVGAGLLIRTSVELQRVDPGFDPVGALSLRLSLPEGADLGDEAVGRTFGRIVDEVATLPGVTAAAAVSQVPLGGGDITNGLIPEGSESRDDHVFAALRLSTPGIVDALGVPLIRGRGLTERDDQAAPPVMVVNRVFAEQAFPGENPVGKRVGCCVSGDHPDFWREIVGVVGATRSQGLGNPAPPEFYLPVAQAPPRSWDWLQRTLVLVVRAENPTGARQLVRPVREAVRRVDPTLPIYDVKTLDERLSLSTDRTRYSSLLLTVLGAVALVLAGAGIYGVLAVFVSQRTRELGVRSALGATASELVGLVLGRALIPTLLGVAVGLPAALGVGRLLAGFLDGVEPADPLTLAGVTAGLTAVAFLAAWLPARRATKIDPVRALRAE